MSLAGFKARNHPQQVGKRGALERVDDRRTPAAIFDPLHAEFAFTLDVAASRENTKLPRWNSVYRSGLLAPWTGERVWCNPPYSDCGAWVAKANCEDAALVVMLLPANRTEQRWWQEHVEPYRRGGLIESRFLPGRIRFDVPPGTYADPRGNRPPFGNVVLVWRGAVVGHDNAATTGNNGAGLTTEG